MAGRLRPHTTMPSSSLQLTASSPPGSRPRSAALRSYGTASRTATPPSTSTGSGTSYRSESRRLANSPRRSRRFSRSALAAAELVAVGVSGALRLAVLVVQVLGIAGGRRGRGGRGGGSRRSGSPPRRRLARSDRRTPARRRPARSGPTRGAGWPRRTCRGPRSGRASRRRRTRDQSPRPDGSGNPHMPGKGVLVDPSRFGQMSICSQSVTPVWESVPHSAPTVDRVAVLAKRRPSRSPWRSVVPVPVLTVLEAHWRRQERTRGQRQTPPRDEPHERDRSERGRAPAHAAKEAHPHPRGQLFDGCATVGGAHAGEPRRRSARRVRGLGPQ